MTVSQRTGLPARGCPPRMENYDAAYREYAPSVPARYNPVVDIVERLADTAPDYHALVSVGPDGETFDTQTAADLAANVRRAARALLRLGVGKGDSIFLMLPRCPEWYFALLGAMRIGAVPMPAPNMLTPKDIAYRIARGGARFAITDESGAEKIDAIAGDVPGLATRILVSGGWASGSSTSGGMASSGKGRVGWSDFASLLGASDDAALPADPTASDDPLLIFFTSGTVSMPKMVLHRQGYALGHVATARFWHDLREGDRHWTVSDTGWAKAAWGGLFGQWHERATVIQVALGKPDPDLILDIIAKQHITSFCAPPTLYRQLVLADLKAHDLSALRHCTSAGEPLNPEVIRAWREGTGGLTIYDGYGQSETSLLVGNYRAVAVRPGSMGKPTPGYAVDIVDDDGAICPHDAPGAIAVRTDPPPVGLFSHYPGEDDATTERFRGGWYLSGDRGRRDADGYLWFEGRDDDVITSSAYRIGPFEVESALIEHAAVAEAGVVGKPDPERTEIVCAFVILAPGHSPTPALAAALQAHVRAVTAPYKYPREIVFVSELPKTISGKIRRSELRSWFASGIPSGVLLEGAAADGSAKR